MPWFKQPKTGKIIEFTEEVAEQILRPQGKYIEVEAPSKEKEVEAPSIDKKKSKKKIVKKTTKGNK